MVTLRKVFWPAQMGLGPGKFMVALEGGVFTVTVVLLPGAPTHEVVASLMLVMV